MIAGHLPLDWRVRVPRPIDYFPKHIHGLGAPGANGGAQGMCPLHEDEDSTLTVNLNSGHWHCRRCGRGTLPEFHQRLTGMPWVEAVLDLIKQGDAE